MVKKRILEFATFAHTGGTEWMLLQFLRHASHDKYVFYVCSLVGHDLLNKEVSRLGIENIRLNMQGYWDLSAWWKLYKFVKNKRIDLMRTYGLKTHIIGRIVGRFLKIPVNITSVRNTDPWRKWYHVLSDSFTSRFTDLYISNSEAGRLATHRRERVPLSRIITIPNGIDLTKYVPYISRKHEISVEYKQKFGISPTDRVIGIVANLRKQKGHKTIIDALPRILETTPDVKCLFVGGDYDFSEEEIYIYIQEKHLEHTIILTGFRQDIPEILSMFDVFLLPSLWEGFPKSLLEAMAMKTPVVASTVGGIPEIVDPQKTGILIPPQDPKALVDAVIFLLTNPKIATEMGQAGYERVQQHFSIESVVKQTEIVYDQLIEKKRT